MIDGTDLMPQPESEMAEDYLKRFAHHLAVERLRLNKTQRGLAAESGVALDSVRLVEAGEREPRITTAVAFLRSLGRPAWKFLRDVEEAVYGED